MKVNGRGGITLPQSTAIDNPKAFGVREMAATVSILKA